MPSIFPDVRFYQTAVVKSSVDNVVTIVLTGVRVYTVDVTWSPFVPLREAFGLSHSFVGNQEAGEDLINLMTVLRNIPLVVRKGTQLPYYYFARSPFVDPEYFTFLDNYYLQGLSCKPVMHIDSSYTLYPPSIQAWLSVDLQVTYARIPLRAHTAVPDGYHQELIDGYSVRYPPQSGFAVDGYADAFGQQMHIEPYTRWLYVDACSHFSTVNYETYGQGGLIWQGALKVTDTGRYYYYGDESDSNYPFRALEPVPPSSRRISVSVGAFDHISGTLRGVTKGTGLIYVEPPPHKEVVIPGIGIAPVMAGLLMGLRLYARRHQAWSGKIDGTWKIGTKEPHIL